MDVIAIVFINAAVYGRQSFCGDFDNKMHTISALIVMANDFLSYSFLMKRQYSEYQEDDFQWIYSTQK